MHILQNLAVSNVISNAINIGNRLNLFKTLADISSEKGPVLPEQLAEAAGCKERFLRFFKEFLEKLKFSRYIREWCNCMACGQIIEVNEEEKFWIAAENVQVIICVFKIF